MMRRVYIVLIKVRPAPNNPDYWKIQFGFMNVWLTAEDPEEAAQRAGNELDRRFWEIADAKCLVSEPTEPISDLAHARLADSARAGQPQLELHACEPGADESVFAGLDFKGYADE
jgi:hypothetical protein